MYCFQHGLPTRNPGTWLPGATAPWCGNAHCAKLATDVWPQLLLRGVSAKWHLRKENWMRRVEEECETCRLERARRCCTLAAAGDGAGRHLHAPFADAAFVHPFRHPSYLATQLRAINFVDASTTMHSEKPSEIDSEQHSEIHSQLHFQGVVLKGGGGGGGESNINGCAIWTLFQKFGKRTPHQISTV